MQISSDFFRRNSCVFQFFVVILHRKMKNRAPVAKKVLRYLAHAEGICLSGWGGKYGHIEKGVLRALFWLVGIW